MAKYYVAFETMVHLTSLQDMSSQAMVSFYPQFIAPLFSSRQLRAEKSLRICDFTLGTKAVLKKPTRSLEFDFLSRECSKKSTRRFPSLFRYQICVSVHCQFSQCQLAGIDYAPNASANIRMEIPMIMRHAIRIGRCLVEIMTLRQSFSGIMNAVLLYEML